MLRRLLIAVLATSALAFAVLRMHDQQLPRLEAALADRAVGAFHVHSVSSHDCDVTLEEITARAASLGLDFVVVTDHNNQLAGPVRINDVLVVSSAETSTPFGHVINLGGSQVLAKKDRGGLDIHDKLRAVGGVPIITHPADNKRPWTGPLGGAGGLEIASFASSARRQGGPVFVGLLPSLIAYRLNPPLALAQVYDRDERALKRWDEESNPRMVGLCGTDTHGRYIDVGLNMSAWLVGLTEPLPADPDAQPTAIIEHLTSGHFYCVAGLFGRDVLFELVARRSGEVIASTGDVARADAVDELTVTAPRSTTETPTIVLLRNGEEVARTQGTHLRYAQPSAGTYRTEVRLPVPGILFGYRIVPVIYSNRIRVAPSPGVASSVGPGSGAR
jgi:hypothetical protein